MRVWMRSAVDAVGHSVLDFDGERVRVGVTGEGARATLPLRRQPTVEYETPIRLRVQTRALATTVVATRCARLKTPGHSCCLLFVVNDFLATNDIVFDEKCTPK